MRSGKGHMQVELVVSQTALLIHLWIELARVSLIRGILCCE